MSRPAWYDVVPPPDRAAFDQWLRDRGEHPELEVQRERKRRSKRKAQRAARRENRKR